MSVHASGNDMVKTQSEMQAEGAATNEEAVGMEVDNLNTGAQAAGTVGAVTDITGTVGKAMGASSVPIVSQIGTTMSLVSDVAGAASDVTAGALGGVASVKQGDALGAANKFTSAAGSAANYGVDEASNDNGFLDAKSKTLEAAADADAGGSSGE